MSLHKNYNSSDTPKHLIGGRGVFFKYPIPVFKYPIDPPGPFLFGFPYPHIFFVLHLPQLRSANFPPMILVTPELNVPAPFAMTNEEILSIHEKAKLAFNTVEFLRANGLDDAETAVTTEDKKTARSVFMDNPTTTLADINTPGKALMLKALLDEYDIDVIRNAQQVRSYIKLKLLEKSDCGDNKVELKALEMLGKMSDVGAFAERVEINVTHRTTEELENELASKLSQYLGDIIDVEAKNVTSMDVVSKAPAVQVIDIDAELGFVGGELVEDGQENDSTE